MDSRQCAGRAALSREISVDLPTLGKPTKPTSASNFSSSRKSSTTPGVPGSALRGAWWVEVAKRALPRPPRPPLAAITCMARRVKIPKFFAAGQVVNHRAHRERHDVIRAVFAVAV